MILVTGFEPYDGSPINPSSLVLRHLPDVIGNTTLCKITLSCDSQRTPSQVTALVSAPAIGGVVILGEDRRYALPTLENTAYNCLNYEVPDNAGNKPMRTHIVEQGPDSLTTSIDVEAVRLALVNQGIVIDVANDPGRHLCNHVYYTLLYHQLIHSQTSTAILLFHLPRLPEQQVSPSLLFNVTFRATLALITQFAHERSNI